MSCRRIRRELLWLVRFGDFDAGSAPHLEHLASCRGCRDEVGLDRALVRQLRTALAARVGDASPSPSAWEGVLARMRQPEPSVLRPWAARLAALLRSGSAVAGASLALVLALNVQMVPIGPIAMSDASDVSVVTTPSAGSGAGLRHPEWREPIAGTAVVRTDQTGDAGVSTTFEQLPLARTAVLAAAEADAAPAPDPTGGTVEQRHPAVVLRLVPYDAAAMSAASESIPDELADDQPAPAVPPAGGPS